MLVLLVAFLGGVLTIVSPCILPVLPFVFARGGRSFRSHTLPMLASMAVAFAAVTSLAAVSGAWVVALNESARYAALVLLGVFGLTLLMPAVGDYLSRPLVALGARLTAQDANRPGASALLPIALGVGTGLLWAPCAGPILGLLLTGAALNGANVGTSLLLLVFACGAATALAAALWLGRGMATALRRFLPVAGRMRRIAGAAILAGVAAPALGLDTNLLTRIPTPATTSLEQGLVERLQRPAVSAKSAVPQGPLSYLGGATEWINSPALGADALQGKVVLVNFWTYSCINCLRTLPYLRAWAEKYKDAGLVVVGVHTPEFAFEKRSSNVSRAVGDLGISYPVAIDNDFRVWRSFANRSWPGFYLIDSHGQVRHQVAGEHAYERTEQVIRTLLSEAGQTHPMGDAVRPAARGVEAAPDLTALLSGETYLGYERATDFAPGRSISKDRDAIYTPSRSLGANQWTLAGHWRIEGERAVVVAEGGRVVHRFQARDLHMVLGPASDGRPVRFRVLVDGKPPHADHGSDTNAQGEGVIDRQKLYQLVRQGTSTRERLFEIEFLDPGAEAYAFTFG